MWLAILVTAVCCLLVLFLTEKEPEPICGVYRQPGKWYSLKYLIFRALYAKRQWDYQRQAALAEGKDAKTGTAQVKTIDMQLSPEQMEQVQPLSEEEKAFDAVFFIAANQDGFYLATGMERRRLGMVNTLCYLRVPGVGLLCSERLPNTALHSDTPDQYSGGGVLFQMLKPMEKWRIRYHGKMFLKHEPTKIFDVKFDADWSSEFDHFDYETDMHPGAVAAAFAREKWSAKFFKDLKEAHQSHYEQMGHLRGSLLIDGVQTYNITAQAFRDHSFGKKRDWELMRRYAFHILFLQDGSSLVVAVICQPCTSSRLEVGYTCSAAGEMHPVEWCSLELHRHGEGGTPPTDYSFQYRAGGHTRTLEVQVVESSEHRVHEARMVERFVRVKDDGLPGWGVSEWHYHHSIGLPHA